MTKQEILVNLSGQAINGLLSSNESWIGKIVESSLHDQVADLAFLIAKKISEKIIEETKNEPQIN